MNRDIDKGDDEPVLWHNLYGSEKTNAEEILREFEKNAALLRNRSNGNALYHEILSFSDGFHLSDAELKRVIADIGQEYLRERAPGQLAYGVIHKDTDHAHLHLMISANRLGESDRVRLSKREFADIQKKIEAFAMERFPELMQTKVYDRERHREKLKTDNREQMMKVRTKEPSRKEQIKSKLHGIFAQAQSAEELARLCQKEGFSFYQRGRTTGVLVRGEDGQESKHRLATLGVEEHYLSTNQRLAMVKPREPQKEKPKESEPAREETPAPGPAPASTAEPPDRTAEYERRTSEQLGELLKNRDRQKSTPDRDR